jgi:hypothetical protein
MKKNWTIKVGILMVCMLLVVATGCGELQKAIDKITNQDVDFYQGIYDGGPERGVSSMRLVESSSVSGTGPVEAATLSVMGIAESVLALQADVPGLVMGFSGAAINNADTDSRVYIFFAPSSTPQQGQSVLIGSFAVPARKSVEFVDSQGFDQSPEEVQANLRTYFNQNPMTEVFSVFLFSENVETGSVIVNWMSLDASPVFGWMALIPADVMSGRQDSVKEIVTVSVAGSFANYGDSPARFVWVVGAASDPLNIHDDIVIDVTLSPGQSIDASDGLVVPDGLRRLKAQMENLVDGDSVKGNLIVTSDTDMLVSIKEFKVEFVAKVGL